MYRSVQFPSVCGCVSASSELGIDVGVALVLDIVGNLHGRRGRPATRAAGTLGNDQALSLGEGLFRGVPVQNHIHIEIFPLISIRTSIFAREHAGYARVADRLGALHIPGVLVVEAVREIRHCGVVQVVEERGGEFDVHWEDESNLLEKDFHHDRWRMNRWIFLTLKRKQTIYK